MSIEFGETVRYERHDSEMVEANFEFVLKDCDARGFRENRLRGGKELPVKLREEHTKILEDIVLQCEKYLDESQTVVQKPWYENMILWAKLADDIIVRKGVEREDSNVEDNAKPFKADILFEMSGLFIKGSKAYVQLKIIEVLVFPKPIRRPRL